MIKLFMDKVVEELKLNVVGQWSYQFEVSGVPYDATLTYLLSESHFSIHTFAKYIYIYIKLLIYSFVVTMWFRNRF